MAPYGYDYREAGEDDGETLWRFLAIAAYEADESAARRVPIVAAHLNGWRRRGDFGVIARARVGLSGLSGQGSSIHRRIPPYSRAPKPRRFHLPCWLQSEAKGLALRFCAASKQWPGEKGSMASA